MVIKFDEPMPTKSGRRVSEIWRDLQTSWRHYKSYRLNNDKINMVIQAKEIRRHQADLGCTLDMFPELEGVFTT